MSCVSVGVWKWHFGSWLCNCALALASDSFKCLPPHAHTHSPSKLIICNACLALSHAPFPRSMFHDGYIMHSIVYNFSSSKIFFPVFLFCCSHSFAQSTSLQHIYMLYICIRSFNFNSKMDWIMFNYLYLEPLRGGVGSCNPRGLCMLYVCIRRRCARPLQSVLP